MASRFTAPFPLLRSPCRRGHSKSLASWVAAARAAGSGALRESLLTARTSPQACSLPPWVARGPANVPPPSASGHLPALFPAPCVSHGEAFVPQCRLLWEVLRRPAGRPESPGALGTGFRPVGISMFSLIRSRLPSWEIKYVTG